MYGFCNKYYGHLSLNQRLYHLQSNDCLVFISQPNSRDWCMKHISAYSLPSVGCLPSTSNLFSISPQQSKNLFQQLFCLYCSTAHQRLLKPKSLKSSTLLCGFSTQVNLITSHIPFSLLLSKSLPYLAWSTEPPGLPICFYYSPFAIYYPK